MRSICLVCGITMIGCLLYATSAFATFSGTMGEGKSGPVVFTIPGATVECPFASDIYGIAGGAGQEAELNLITWSFCEVKLALSKLAVAVECNFITLEQPFKEGVEHGKATLSFTKECKVVEKTSKCEVKIPTSGNQFLRSVSLSKTTLFLGPAVQAAIEVTGMSATVNAICTAAGLKSTTEGKFKTTFTLVDAGLT